ncbi:hypothetical protein [Desulfobacter hydrogenophilus]|nr:hypothetical protein [Desulfobacter hydrogenophilus]NDY72896.1 hypothetical protein [Desulfobacter hydrogenophilus]
MKRFRQFKKSLGLSISYGIIKDYGGTISVDRGRADGALFTIHFPFLFDQ